jgi:hypothetical protein
MEMLPFGYHLGLLPLLMGLGLNNFIVSGLAKTKEGKVRNVALMTLFTLLVQPWFPVAVGPHPEGTLISWEP